MKKALLATTVALFTIGTAYAHESTGYSPIVPHSVTIIGKPQATNLRLAGSDEYVRCTETYFLQTHDDGSKALRKSIDCEE